MIYVSPSYQGLPFDGEPYDKGGKLYVKVIKAGKPKEVRAYEDWQAAWPASKRPRVEKNSQFNQAFNYNGRYPEVVGIRQRLDGQKGIWIYENFSYDLLLNDLFGPFLPGDVVPKEGGTWVAEEDLVIGPDCVKKIRNFDRSILKKEAVNAAD